MRADGLTTAKMLQVVTNLYNQRRLRYEQQYLERKGGVHVREYCMLQRVLEEQVKGRISEGISRLELINELEVNGFRDVLAGIEDATLLVGYAEELEELTPDLTKEDDGSSSNIEHAEEVGFVGLRQLEAEERVGREKDERNVAAE